MSNVIFETYTTSVKNKSSILCTEWHSTYPFFAVSTSNGVVTVYNEDGERIEECNLSRSSPCTAMAWHPVHNMLFTGWKDGVLMLYDDTKGLHISKEIPQYIHQCAIRRMKWNVDGTRLITTDVNGNVGIWRLDKKSKISHMAKVYCSELVDHIVFKRTDAMMASTADGKSESGASVSTLASTVANTRQASSTRSLVSESEETSDLLIQSQQWIFFFGGDKGTIFIADDVGHVKKFIETGTTSLATLLYEEATSYLIYLTSSSFLYTYAVRDDLSAEKIYNVKISTSSSISAKGGYAKLKAIYIGAGVLATCSNETFVRVWNLDNDENFVLNDRRIDEPIEDISFNPRKRAIAGITASWRVFVWQYIGDSLSLPAKGAHSYSEELEDSDDDEEAPSRSSSFSRHRSAGNLFGQSRNSLQDWEFYAFFDGKLNLVRNNYSSPASPNMDAGNSTSAAADGQDNYNYSQVMLQWGPGETLLSVYGINDLSVSILHETVLKRVMRNGISVVYVSGDYLRIERLKGANGDESDEFFEGTGPYSAGGLGYGSSQSNQSNRVIPIRSNVKIKYFDVAGDFLVVSSGRKIEVWELREGLVRLKTTLDIASRCIALHQEGIFVVPLIGTSTGKDAATTAGGTPLSPNRVEVYSYSGTRKYVISFSAEEGPVVDIDIRGDYIAFGTYNNYVYLWQMAGREAKQYSQCRKVYQYEYRRLQKMLQKALKGRKYQPVYGGSQGKGAAAFAYTEKLQSANSVISQAILFHIPVRRIVQVRVNCTGTKIAVLMRFIKGNSMFDPATDFCVYNIEQDREDVFDLRPANRQPTNLYWDEVEAKLLAIEAKKYNVNAARREEASSIATSGNSSYDGVHSLMTQEQGKISVCTLFATPDHGVLLYDSFSLDIKIYNGLVGISVPFLYFVRKDAGDYSSAAAAASNIMVGSASTDDMGKRAYSYNLSYVDRYFMRDFKGIEDIPHQIAGGSTETVSIGYPSSSLRRTTRDALLNFSYYLTIGNMEEAYKAVKMIKDASVWNNMARMCVKTKKLEVAEICLGNMQDARASMALREAKNEPEIEARIAMLAIYLGLVEEAEKLYSSCGRYDLLNKMYQSTGKWDQALEVAESQDRIHLRTTHYYYARYLESIGDINGAVKHYEKSKTHFVEVPRMLFERNYIRHLETYIKSISVKYNSFLVQQYQLQQANDGKPASDIGNAMGRTIEEYKREYYKSEVKQLMRWWAQYNEGIGEFEKAFEYYRLAEDHLSLVRMFCFAGKLKDAADVVIQSNDLAAAYRMAAELERTGYTKPAIEFYMMANSFKNAIRLARYNDLSQDVMNLALSAPDPIKIDAALYFEEKGMMEKAVLLYQKGGYLAKSMDLCFRAYLFEQLSHIAESLSSQFERQQGAGTIPEDQQVDPEIVTRCGDFFMYHGKFDKAVTMYTYAGESTMALDICHQHYVMLTDEMAERIVSSEDIERLRTARTDQDYEKLKKTRELLYRVAKVAAQQGYFELATKKFVYAGDKETAMKVLIKSGNTEKIKFFAEASRKAELFILAANYLQNLDWHNQPETMKSIISFYTKAKAWAQLARFYEACSQVEIDDYRNYDKALDALKEALKIISKVTSVPAQGAQQLKQYIAYLKNRIYLVDKFIMAQSLTKSDPAEMLKLCEQLLTEIDTNARQYNHAGAVEDAVRTGDVYALMIEYYYSQKDRDNLRYAYDLMLTMMNKRIVMSFYLDPPIVQDICNKLGVEMLDMNTGEDDGSHYGGGQNASNASYEMEDDEDVQPFQEEAVDD